MVTKKDIDELKAMLEDIKTEQRKVNNIFATEIDKINARLDNANKDTINEVKKKTEEEYRAEIRKKNMHKYLNAITCGPSAFRAKDINDYAEN